MSTTMEHFDVYKVTFDAYNARSFNYGAATPSTAIIVTDIDTLHAIVWYMNYQLTEDELVSCFNGL